MSLYCLLSSSPAPYPRTVLLLRLLVDAARAVLCPILMVVQFAVVGLLIFAEIPSLAAESPTEVVRTTINDVIRILKDKELKAPDKLLPRRRLLENVIGERFDYAEMSKRALAANWTPLTSEQRDEFVDLFKAFLSDRYAAKIEGYSGEQVEYLGERLDGQFAEVRTKLVSKKVEIPMDYRLINKAGRWYAYDIIVDGVSLVKNYRSQFTTIIRSSSYEELVHRLRNRTVDERNTG
jgi:phospholipid transport system substrate-binding protein